jgi:hypothetical protein
VRTGPCLHERTMPTFTCLVSNRCVAVLHITMLW